MKKIIIISIALLALIACEAVHKPEEVKASSNQSYPVEKLFTVDNITLSYEDRTTSDTQETRKEKQV